MAEGCGVLGESPLVERVAQPTKGRACDRADRFVSR
jgi:hypothetical protein